MGVSINPAIDKLAIKDINELEEKIGKFVSGELDSEKFRAFRLARGVYGQRQLGVQMIRIKLPYGKVNPTQLVRIADLSDKFGSGNLHATTRQDVQVHYVQLANTPQFWADLEDVGVTLREACGNTVRNITASAVAGIDPEELFDVSPYAHEMYKYFLRNPICQEMGRKIKIAFSSSDKDSAYVYIHDLGFIPRVKTENGVEQRGFKVVVAGGLGAQPFMAHDAFEFLPEDQLIPFTEAVLRVFDRYGERTRRHKARMKYLMSDIGYEAFIKLVEEERTAIKTKSYVVNRDTNTQASIPVIENFVAEAPVNAENYKNWFDTNVFEQKQKGLYAAQVRLTNGDMKSAKARAFAEVVSKYASDDIRVTVNQGYQLKNIALEYLPNLFNALTELGLATAGFDSITDITACPGTDTCNLGIASSMGLSVELERVMLEEYPDLIHNNDIKIKISGCMNGCGQHNASNIGFHGMSLKSGELVMPAMQVLLGGGFDGKNKFTIGDKVIKLPSKNIPEALRILLNDYDENGAEGEYFNDYYFRQGKNYFYTILKPLGNTKDLGQEYFIDWGETERYETAVGVGECANMIVDMVGLILLETEDKLNKSKEAFAAQIWADSIYHAYNVYVNTAKAMLLTKDVACNTQHGILKDFDANFIATGEIKVDGAESFSSKVLQINKNEPTEEFAKTYIAGAAAFIAEAKELRNKQISAN